jgi:hypothetical protein
MFGLIPLHRHLEWVPAAAQRRLQSRKSRQQETCQQVVTKSQQ